MSVTYYLTAEYPNAEATAEITLPPDTDATTMEALAKKRRAWLARWIEAHKEKPE